MGFNSSVLGSRSVDGGLAGLVFMHRVRILMVNGINLYNHEFVMHFVVSWQAVCLVVAVVNVDVLETNPSRPCRENLHAQL